MKLRNIIILTLTVILPQALLASRVKSEWKTYTQPDGTTLVLQLCGDEHFTCYRADDGRLFTLDSLGIFQPLNPQQASQQATHARKAMRHQSAINTNWDPNKIYRQMVVLVAPSDVDFSASDPHAFFDSMLNEPGFNKRQGVGCAADYFRDQSGGLFNLQFDVFGPYKASQVAQPYTNPNSKTHNHGNSYMLDALQTLLAEETELDFSPYDWNNDGYVDQVVAICAGYGGNTGGENFYGYLWPNTSSLSKTLTTHDGKKISAYSVSAELWPNKASCGIGTVCHEFSHCLGLPDIYPTNGWVLSAVDEWDLMDGGNYTNYGWCPPNYSALEKMLLGWLTPTELTEPATITGMKPVSEGGEVYLIRHTDNEYLLLENRQHTGWDAGTPGSGLIIFHVNYKESLWRNNRVNDTQNQLNYDIIHADGLDYTQWDNLMDERGISSSWQNKPMMNNWHLSTSPYPWATDSTETNNQLTDESSPAPVMFNKNADGSLLLSKPITNIQVSADGYVSFNFMGGDPTAISIPVESPRDKTATGRQGLYDLQGHRRKGATGKGLYIEIRQDGTIRKVII